MKLNFKTKKEGCGVGTPKKDSTSCVTSNNRKRKEKRKSDE